MSEGPMYVRSRPPVRRCDQRERQTDREGWCAGARDKTRDNALDEVRGRQWEREREIEALS